MNALAIPAALVALAEEDENVRKMLAELPEAWAHIPVDEPATELGVVQAYLRACYGCGYTAALRGPLDCPVPGA